MKKSLLKNWERLFKAVGILKKGFVCELFYELTNREQAIISMRFGLENGITNTLEDVAKEFGVTRERIRQIEAKALERLRQGILL